MKEKLSSASLINNALAKVGYDNWGQDNFQEALDRLVDSFLTDDKPNVFRRMYFREECTRLLSNRLRMEKDRESLASVEVDIGQPIFITGLSRTGTTLLQNLLSLDEKTRSLEYWELIFPSPPPTRETYESDPRIEMAKKRVDAIYNTLPDLKGAHLITPRSPEECGNLMKQSFRSFSFYNEWRVPGYISWLKKQDMTIAYEYYKKTLFTLLARFSKERLLLKETSHLSSMDCLLKVFPKAKIIWTHRDPMECIPSFYSITIKHFGNLSREEIALGISHLSEIMNKAIGVRKSANTQAFHDVPYKELVGKPIEVVCNLYEKMGYEMSEKMLSRMKAWLNDNYQNKHGKHQYDAKALGIDPVQLEREFAVYREDFGRLCYF